MSYQPGLFEVCCPHSRRQYLSENANAKSFGGSGGFEISGEVREKMEELLLNPSLINYGENISEIVSGLGYDLTKESYHFVDQDRKFSLRTFKSTKINKTLALMLNIKTKSLDYYVEEKSSTIVGPNIKKDFENLQANPLGESEIKKYLLEKPNLIDSFISQNKFMVLVPNELKILYITENILDISGVNQYLQIL